MADHYSQATVVPTLQVADQVRSIFVLLTRYGDDALENASPAPLGDQTGQV